MVERQENRRSTIRAIDVFYLPVLAARNLFDGGIEAIEQIGCSDHQDERGQTLLIVMLRSLFPDRVRYWICSIREAGSGLSQSEGRAFGVGEVGSLAPG